MSGPTVLSSDLRERLAAAVRAHLTQARAQIVSMTRAGPGLGDDDARQLVNGLYAMMLEALEDKGTAHRTSFFEDALPAYRAAGMPRETAIKGIVRAYTVMLGDVIADFSPEARVDIGRWVGEFAGAAACDALVAFGGANGE